MRRVAVHVAALVLLTAAWFLVTSGLHLVHELKLPSPAATFDAIRKGIQSGYQGEPLWKHILVSLWLAMRGLAIGATVGIALGLAMGYSKIAYWCINPFFQLLRPIPPMAWIPLTIVWLGIGDTSKLLIVAIAVTPAATINTFTGLKTTDTALLEAARSHGAGRNRCFFSVRVPAALPYIFAGLRISLQLSWMVLVAAELVGAFSGIGYVLINSARSLDSAMTMAAMLAIGVVGALMTGILSFISRKVMPWQRT